MNCGFQFMFVSSLEKLWWIDGRWAELEQVWVDARGTSGEKEKERGRAQSCSQTRLFLQQVLGLLLARRLNVIRRPFEIFGQYVLTQQVSKRASDSRTQLGAGVQNGVLMNRAIQDTVRRRGESSSYTCVAIDPDQRLLLHTHPTDP